MSIARPNINFNTRQTVTQEVSTKPYVGFEHLTDLPDGWRFDIKRWSSLFDLKLPNLPRLLDPSSQGVSASEYFLSGVGSVDLGDLFVEGLYERVFNYEKHWIPLVTNGFYFRYDTDYFYYSDDSKIQYISASENRDGRNYIELEVDHKRDTPILAATFRRHPTTFTPSYYKRVNQRAKFTGTYLGGEEKQTVSDLGTITWANVDTTKKEFIVDQTIDGLTRLFFNRDYTDSVGVTPENYTDLGACEQVGISTGVNWQAFRLQRFPILESGFTLYMANPTNKLYHQLVRVNTWWELSTTAVNPTDVTRYYLDKDLGIVYFGSNVYGGIPQLGRELVAKYNTTLRIEYEEADRPQTIKAWDADTSPVTQSLNQGFVCITHDVVEATSIILSINKAPIVGQIDPKHYPITVGADYGLLKAYVNSSTGLPVSATEVTFTMSPTTIGYLDGGTGAVSATSAAGTAYSTYQPPVSADALGFYSITVRASTNPYYPNSKDVIIMKNETGLVDREEEIYLYQIVKDDILLGYETISSFLTGIPTPGWVVDSASYAIWSSEMILEHDLKDWVDPVEGQPIEGRKVIIYQIGGPPTDPYPNMDPYAIHPIFGTYGAAVPVRPTLAEKITDTGDPYVGFWRLIYPEDAVPDCGALEAVGGYWIASSRLVEFQASCWSPYYNRTIYSNKIIARISLPNYLLGEYVNDLGEKIPFGWKILGDLDNVAAGIDGATFLTINPHSGPYEILDLVNGGSTDEWAAAPFKSVGFQFEIEYSDWAAITSYLIGDFVLSTAGDTYSCSTAGTSSAAEPTWNTTAGATTSDGTAEWTKV